MPLCNTLFDNLIWPIIWFLGLAMTVQKSMINMAVTISLAADCLMGVAIDLGILI